MLIHNEYLYEIPEDKLLLTEDDKTFLEQLKENHKDEVTTKLIRHDKEGKEYELTMKSGYKHWHVKFGTEYERTHPLWDKISVLFKNTVKGTPAAVRKSAHLGRISGPLAIHIDELAIKLNIPLVDLSRPVTFWSSRDEDKKILYQYYYKKYQPVILNTRINHNVIDNDQDRIFLQVGGFDGINYFELMSQAFPELPSKLPQ